MHGQDWKMTPPRTCPALLSAASVVFEGRADRCGQTVDVHRVSGGLVFRQFAPQLLPINVRYFEIDDHVIPSLCYVSLGQCQPGREGRVEHIAGENVCMCIRMCCCMFVLLYNVWSSPPLLLCIIMLSVFLNVCVPHPLVFSMLPSCQCSVCWYSCMLLFFRASVLFIMSE